MKKNISINISGIIFHIEEDGYETLKKYLDSINKYFSTFEDSSEILADIESRIAEIFLSKLNEEKQIITVEDVNSLVATMGSVSDFKAAEDVESPEFASATAEDARTENTTSSEQSYSSSEAPPPPRANYNPSKQLLRDQKRKILGGVCSGLGNYFNIDPLWVRLLFALLFFAYGITFIIYIVMWIIVPGSYDLDEPVVGKKMFRDPERKIIGGVSGGVAAFLNLDIIAVRVIFIALIFGAGIGVFLYIVLWLILPEAKTLTDRVQMQGEPVTLSNIESTIKKSQTDKVTDDESTFTKIILFPFRLIGMILTGIGRVLVPVLEIIRVAIGVMVVMIGISLVFSIVVTAGILFGIFSAATFSLPWLNEFTESTVPVDIFLRAFPGWTAVAGFLGTLIPSIFIVMLGVSVIAKRIVFSATAGWTLFVLFFVSVALLAVGIPKIVFSFKEDGNFKIENQYTLNGKTAVLKINEVGMDDYHATQLALRGYDGKEFKLIQEFEAQGTTRAKAIENAHMVDYTVDVRDSIFTFDSNMRFKPDAIFRAQRLNMTLYIPYNHPFIMDEGVSRLVREYIRWEDREDQTWKMTEENGLECISCAQPEKDGDDGEENWSAGLNNFDEVEISGKFDVRIKNGHDYNVELIGPENEKSKYKIYVSGSTLVIDYQSKNIKWGNNLNIEDMRINITMPSLQKLEATGMGSIRFDNFHQDDMEIESRGPVDIRGEISTRKLSINLTGKSELELSGNADNLDAQLELASKLRAYSLNVQDAIVEVTGGSTAKVNVAGNLEIEEGVASEVDYRGSPNVVKRD
jgi:phage shock protein PspC (stress-responsive transcriptional regulator)